MDFSLSHRIVDLKDRVRGLLDEAVLPLEEDLQKYGWAGVEAPLEEVREAVKREGLWAPHFDPEYGGMGLSLVDFAQVGEVLGRSVLGHYAFGCQAPDAGNMELLHAFGSEAQKARWLEPLAAGRIRSCFAMTESEHAGSNPTLLSTRAERHGDEYVLSGHKWFVTGADGAALCIVMAVTHPDAEPHRRAALFLVPMESEGVDLVRNLPVGGEPGSGWLSHGELRFHEVRVPADHRLGGEGSGFALAQARLGPGRIHHCMRWIGICERAFDLMCERASGRTVAPGRLLASQQMVQGWIAECRAKIDAARLMVLKCAWEIEHAGAQAVRQGISLIKFFCADVLLEVLDRAIQVHGALGLTDDLPLAAWWRHERGARLYDGPDEVHKLSVARRILQDYARHDPAFAEAE
ncbi:MAG: acyl-CoA dehydrogenase [Deltaproteobacteria bacterium]|nr:MAG: acyl-CoA dehydrogenase [Deltaproteobacteria bacterium]